MSLFDYRLSLEISAEDPSFAAIIMAAMRKADTDNADKLRHMWPRTWDELQARYHAPGGILPSEQGQFKPRNGPDRRQRHLIRSDERREEGRDRRQT